MSIQVPLNNLKKRAFDFNPENIGADKKGGRSIHIRGRPGPDGNISFKRKEGETLINLIQKDDYVIVLDEKGKQFYSEQLAKCIQLRANESRKTLIFIIGGAYGADNSVLDRADFVWSLSKLVFPHQVVRLLLAEQVYRACTILKNEKYHHK
jgi:23S rRNA (pseudouridine1915-N3)-methyltransferase